MCQPLIVVCCVELTLTCPVPTGFFNLRPRQSPTLSRCCSLEQWKRGPQDSLLNELDSDLLVVVCEFGTG